MSGREFDDLGIDQFSIDHDTWDALCMARVRYRRGIDRSEWYHALRTHCGYTGGNHSMKGRMEKAVDAWLAAHPSWTGKYL